MQNFVNNHPVRRQPGRCALFGLLLGLLVFLAAGPAPVLAQAPAVPLRAIEIKPLANPAPPRPAGPRPSFKESRFPLEEAVNLAAVSELIGPLSEEQRAVLEEKRFLLLPKKKFMLARPDKSFPANEMLANFDGLGGSLEESERKPANARLVGPDVILHAFHLYTASRLEAVEAGPLRRTAISLLAGLLDNAERLKRNASISGDDWERLMAQLTVPLVLLENCAESDEADQARPDTFENALNALDKYRPKFSPAMLRNIRDELRRIYSASAQARSLLGLSPVDGLAEIDYSRFKTRGHYNRLSSGRAYYRAMVWLKELGWDGLSNQGLTDALNFALAMSYAPPAANGQAPQTAGSAVPGGAGEKQPEAGPAVPSDVRSCWARLVEIDAFFQGTPSGLSYQQWLPFLMKEAGVPEFTADTGADREVITRLRSAKMQDAATESGFEVGRRIISFLPRPTSLPRTFAEYLSRGPGAREKLPDMFSALWIPAMWGNPAAADMLPRQAALTVGAPPSDLSEEEKKLEARSLSSRLQGVGKWFEDGEADRYPSLPLAELKLMKLLSAEFGSGYPLYMKSRAFQVKRIESAAAVFTELAHDSPSLNRPLALASSEGSAKGAGKSAAKPEAPTVVKGFVEPDLNFWGEMLRLTAYLEAAYKKYGLLSEDLEDFGALRRFTRRLERCYALAEKELKGLELNDDDYEFIRLFSLDWMALPPGDPGGRRPVGQQRSALVSDVRVVPGLNVNGQGVMIYQATAEPWLMLALVGNEKSPRLVLGLAYSHYEFAGPLGRVLDDASWRKVVYARYSQTPLPEGLGLPPKNFWYDELIAPGGDGPDAP